MRSSTGLTISRPFRHTDALVTDAATETSLVGSQVDKYRVLRVIGRGGMGAVYEAVHETLGQRIAIKVLKTELSSDTRHVQRFFDEARAASIVQHPGLIKVFDFGHLQDGTAYITMEFLQGETLQERIARAERAQQRLDLVDVLRISRQVGSALEAVHAKGIAHRDLKPANLFLVPDNEAPSGERAKILDFGIAKFYDSSKVGDTTPSGQPHHLTTVGKLLGTPAYMSPEQCSGAEQIDDSIDVYALGVILYQMLAGRLPFEAPHAVLIMTKHITEPPPQLSPAELSLPAALCDLVHEMLAKDRQQRPSMAQVVVRIEQLLEAETGASSQQWRSQHRRRAPGRKRWRRILLGIAIVLASLLLIFIGKQRRAQRRARGTTPAVNVAAKVAPMPAPAPKPPPTIEPPTPPPTAAPQHAEPAPVPPLRKRGGARAPAKVEGKPAGSPPVTPPTPPPTRPTNPAVEVPIFR
jgi:serine/threonine protein kinase